MSEFVSPGLPRPGEDAGTWYRRGQERAIALHKEAGEPWQPIGGHYARWRVECPTCGQEVDFGWDEGFGWPGDGTLESECERCGTVQEHTWDMTITVNKGTITTEGKTPPSRDERGRFVAARKRGAA